MRISHLITVCVATALGMASSARAGSILFVDNLDMSAPGLYSSSVGYHNPPHVTNRHVAQGFVSGASGQINTIEINIGKLGNPSPPLLDVEIYTDGGGGPGTFVGSEHYDYSVSEDPDNVITFDFSSANVSLASGTTYYLVLGTSAGTNVSHWNFFFRDLGILGFPGLTSTDGGVNYSDPIPSFPDSELAIRISAVPLPSSMWMGMVMLSCMGIGAVIRMNTQRNRASQHS